MILRKLFLGALILLTSGCTNYLIRKECEKINWFNHGQDLALKGRRINQDDTYLGCKKAEAEIEFSQLDLGWKSGRGSYCTPEGATATGKKGQPLNLDLCDAGPSKVLKERHQSGVRYFCHPKNAYTLGSSGQIYERICPDDMESEFQVEYKKGRQKFLAEMVRQSQAKIQNLEVQLRDEERKKTTTALLLATLPPPTKTVKSTFDPMTNSYRQTEELTDPNESRRSNLNHELTNHQNREEQISKDKSSEMKKMYEYQRELNTMDISNSDSSVPEASANQPSGSLKK